MEEKGYWTQLQETYTQENLDSPRFPVGGPREPVYQFLRSNGFIQSRHSDKQWMRHDGLELHLYGAGSMANIRKDGKLIVDDAREAPGNRCRGDAGTHQPLPFPHCSRNTSARSSSRCRSTRGLGLTIKSCE